jgi:hypothetical protein
MTIVIGPQETLYIVGAIGLLILVLMALPDILNRKRSKN